MTPTPREDTMAEQTEQEPMDPWKDVDDYIRSIAVCAVPNKVIELMNAARAADAAQVRERDAQIASLTLERDALITRANRQVEKNTELLDTLNGYHEREADARAQIARLSAQVDRAELDRDGEREFRRKADADRDKWRALIADATAALGLESGAFYDDVPKHVRALRAERDAAQQQIEKAVDDEQRRIATHVWEKLVPIGVDATDSDGSDTEDPARHIVSWVVGLHDRVSGELVASQQEAKALREALTKLRDCDWTIGRGDRMDAVRDIARAALQSTRPQEQP